MKVQPQLLILKARSRMKVHNVIIVRNEQGKKELDMGVG
jgi:hypothetical protein